MTKKHNRFFSKIKLLASIPSLWLAAFILVLAVASIFLSKTLYECGNLFESSVFSNIFAGLSTGFIITALSGSKSAYTSYLNGKLKWLQQTRELIMLYLTKKGDLFMSHKLSDEDFYNLAYDILTYANDVNNRIIQSTFDKVKWFDPPSYILKHYDYDCDAVAVYNEVFRNYLIEVGNNSQQRIEVVQKFEHTTNILFRLNTNFLNDIVALEIKIASMAKLFI